MTDTSAPVSNSKWRILLVDDEEDMHVVTRMALRKRKWRKRGFELTSAYSRAEALELFKTRRDFHVAILDVVMETNDAGLMLSRDLRQVLPTSTRVIIRTGAAGKAPEEMVLEDYDIDYYLAKPDSTPQKLYSLIRACLRSSQDISTLLAYGRQLTSFTRALREVTTLPDLEVFMREALQFLELKHGCETAFNYDLSIGNDAFVANQDREVGGHDLDEVLVAMNKAYADGLELRSVHAGPELGLSEGLYVMPFEIGSENTATPGAQWKAALTFWLNPNYTDSKSVRDFATDASLFVDNWGIAFSTLKLQERLASERLLREKMYHERMESIATMVTGVAHELNTPLGIVRSSVDMMVELTQAILEDDGSDPEDSEANRDDMAASRDLIVRNLERAQRLIGSFKQLSASQLADDRQTTNLSRLLRDCMETCGPMLRKKSITWSLDDEGVTTTWDGFPGHLSQVILNLVQNAERYAYEAGDDGTLELVLRERPGGFSIVFRDRGKGVPEEILPRIFDPFVTSGRAAGGTGLGMAISRNIVTNLLGGDIQCESTPGEGTTFAIELPTVSEPQKNGGGEAPMLTLRAANQ